MQELDDNALLQEYRENHSEAAFAVLVTRHVNKVHSVALRHTRNPQQAQEITQAVFVILAKKAHQLGRRVILSGWLYETARLTAITSIRSEIRRARREVEAYMQTIGNDHDSATWKQIAPLLDAAMAGLNEKDRQAVVLRFFDGKSLREVGTDLGLNEETAKKRVSRALEKLRNFLARRGMASTTAILAGAISANSVQAAPAGLAATVSAMAAGKGAAAGTSTLTLVKGTMKIMTWTKVKTSIMVVGLVVLAGAGASFAPLAIGNAAEPPSPIGYSNTAYATTSGGRTVKAAGEVALGVRVRGDTARVSLGNSQVDAAGRLTADHMLTVELTVEPEKVLLDGKEQATISASAQEVDVVCTEDKLSVTVDKKLLFDAPMTGWSYNSNGSSGSSSSVSRNYP